MGTEYTCGSIAPGGVISVTATGSTHAVSRELGLRTGEWQPDLMHSAVLFSIRHLGLAKVRGRFDRFVATLTVGETIAATKVEATIDLASINTNNADRDAHLRSTDFFSVDAHPEMRFVSTGIEGVGEEWTLRGDLTLNGRTRPVALDVEFNGVEPFPGMDRVHAGFTATGAIRRSEFGIEFGMLKIGADKLALGDEVKIELDFEFVQPDDAA
jgi:polyisoprenoid-binding protein YceI